MLRRYGCPRLAHLDRATGVPVRRYERDRPGELVHVDVKKLGNIPDGGGHRVHGRQAGKHNRQATTTPAGRTRYRNPILGYGYLHTALDDHSRLAYTEILPGETKDTAAAFLARAHAWYAAAGITIERVLSDNGSCYRSKTWAATCSDLGIIPKRTRPYRPQTNGSIERFHRTLADEWAYAAPTPPKPNTALPLTPGCTPTTITGDTALRGQPPASRVTNLTGQNN